MNNNTPKRPIPKGPPPSSAKNNNTKTFKTHVWDNFEAIYEHVTNGRNDMKTMKSYLLYRASCEHQYAKSLASIANKHADFTIESKSVLSDIWKRQRDSAITLSNQHEQLSNACHKLADDMEISICEVKTVKMACLNAFKKSNLDLTRKSKKHDQYKGDYTKALKNAEMAQDKYNNRGSNLAEKDLHKLEHTLEKSKLTLETTHKNYKDICKELLFAQNGHENLIQRLLTEMEQYERIRIEKLMECLKKYIMNLDFVKNSLDQTLIYMNEQLQKVNTDEEILNCIEKYESKGDRPIKVKYIPLISPLVNHNMHLKNKKSSPIKKLHPPTKNKAHPPNNPHPPSNKPPPTNTTPAAKETYYQAHPPSSKPPLEAVLKAKLKKGPPPLKKNVVEKKATPPEIKINQPIVEKKEEKKIQVIKAKALYNYISEEAGDLNIHENDIIDLIKFDSKDEWWEGTLNGKTGLFPQTYVEIYKNDDDKNNDLENNNQDNNTSSGYAKFVGKAIALYPYEGREVNNEISFHEQEELILTGYVPNDPDPIDWYWGCNSKNETGNIPATYIEIIKSTT